MTGPLDSRTGYADQAKARLRDTILDAMSDLLRRTDWSKITMTAVSKAAGVSRQTLYNEFRSRKGLAEGYAHRLVDRLVDVVHVAIEANVGQVFEGLRQALELLFAGVEADPLVRSLHSGEPEADLLRIVTVDARPILEHAVARLTKIVMGSWMRAPSDKAEIFARAVVRLTLSYVSTPPEPDRDVPADLARFLAPFGEEAVGNPQGSSLKI